MSASVNLRVISFKKEQKEIDGFYKLLVARIPIRSAGEHKYVIPEKGCDLLNANGIINNVDYTVEKLP